MRIITEMKNMGEENETRKSHIELEWFEWLIILLIPVWVALLISILLV